jgi:hypothetical protein
LGIVAQPLGISIVKIEDAGNLLLHHTYQLCLSKPKDLRVLDVLNEPLTNSRNLQELSLTLREDLLASAAVADECSGDHASDAGDFTQRYLI